MKKIVVAICFLLLSQSTFSEEFVYPVSKIDDNNIFVVHQKSIDEVELLLWDVHNKVATKQLSSMFLPSDVKVLPSKQGFSFIDRGRLRIKKFQKRAPKTIDFLEPISSILSIYWIDDDSFYFVGKHHKDYKVFFCDIADRANPELFQLHEATNMDYLYPCKIDNQLFSITKNRLQKYYIIQQDWSFKPYEFESTESKDNNESFDILFESFDPLCFLYMKDSQSGFFLKCNITNKDLQSDGLLSFSCYSCKQEATNNWESKCLFQFKLPTQYLIGNSQKRVYDSICPFLPNYERKDKIYFVDYDQESEKCLLYKYDICEQKISCCDEKKHTKKEDAIAPFLLQDKMYHGLILTRQPVKKFFNFDEESGVAMLELPENFL
ncbi:MAG: hypothetical protein CL947_03200 [Epsilonproteobacteria bacterium]|nr:hypothetical protein [Campylobacterota bacterium]